MNQADYPITTMCRLLGVSTSGYYAWVDRGPSTRDEANARLLETINGIHQQSRRTYGAPRITAELREEGHLVGKNRVARLMKVAGIEGVSRRRKTRTTLRGQDSRPAPDLVERNFQDTPKRFGRVAINSLDLRRQQQPVTLPELRSLLSTVLNSGSGS